MSKKFELNIPFYHPTKLTGCLATTFLMIGNFLSPEKFPLLKSKEVEIHRKIRYWKGGEGELGSFPKLALYALGNKFKVNYYLLGPRYKPPEIKERLWKKYLQNFFPPLEKAKKNPKFKLVTTHCTVRDIITELKRNHPVICEIKGRGFITHVIVIKSWWNNRIFALDPAKGEILLSRKELESKMDLGYMKNFISFSKGN